MNSRIGYNQQVVQGLSPYLQARIPRLDSEQTKALWDAVAEKEEATAKAVQTAQSDIQAAVVRYWDQIFDKPEFCFSLLVLQHLTYPALFFAYEHFLASTIRATKEPKYGIEARDLWERILPDTSAHRSPTTVGTTPNASRGWSGMR